MFSVLAGREIEGDSAAILKGEAGANDPVGIAVLLALVGVAASGHGSVWTALGSVGLELGIGSVVGVGGGFALVWIARNVSLPEHGLYPLRTLAGALVIFGGAAALHGSGFIAVFIAGMIVGDAKLPHEAEIRSFHEAVSQLGEIAVFVPLGLTITLSSFLDARQVLEGVALALILAVVARPVPTVLLLLPSSLAANERYLIAWAGLKGAVPIMLATLPVVDGIDHADAIFHLAVIVVLVSVTLQAASIPWVAARLGLPLRTIDR
jgi:cell volume regulation protein A